MNTKIAALTAVFALCFTTAFAQDIIYKRDGTKDSAVIEEINPTEVVYKKYNRTDGPTYRIYKSNVVLIEYKNGEIEIFNEAPVADPKEKEKQAFINSLGRNIISFNYLNILNGNAHLGYERLFGTSQLFGLKLSLNVNVADVGTDILAYNRKFTTGLDFNIYPTGHGKIKYFLGPSFRVGQLKGYDYYTNYINYYSENVTFNYVSIMFNNGFYIQPTKSLYLAFQAGIGAAQFKTVPGTRYSQSYTELDGMVAFNIGYRF